MVRVFSIVVFCTIILLLLTTPTFGQITQSDPLLRIAAPLLSPPEEIGLELLFSDANGVYYASEGLSFYIESDQDYTNENYDLALACIDKSIEYYKKFELLNNLILTENLYQKLLSNVYCLKAAILDESGQFSKSLSYSNESIKLNPNNEYAWNNKGVALYHLGSRDEAIRCYDSAIEINPHFVSSINNKNIALNGVINSCQYVDTAFGRMWICQGNGSNGSSGKGILWAI